jgi:McrBC 5-methylcytosine restriction system component
MNITEDIVCFEEGSDQPPSISLVTVLSKDMEHLQRLADDGVITLHRISENVSVSGKDRVGLIVLPSGRRLVIRSKIDSLVLLDWLSYLGEFPPLEVWLPDAGVTTGDDFHICIARLFLYELEKVTRLHLRKDYTPVTTDGTTIRGRILTTRLCRRLNHLPHIPQRYRLRTFDTRYNIVLAVALDKLPMLLSKASDKLPMLLSRVSDKLPMLLSKASLDDDRKLLARLRDLWTHVEREIADPISAAIESQWACPPGYRAALQLARLILMGIALDSNSRLGGQAFTLSLALIWERGLRRMFEDISKETGWSCLPDAAHTRRWDDSADHNDKTRWLTVDVIGECDGLRWVLDAKYKRAFGDESRVDRFQMCAYAVAFNADRASLVYPTAREATSVVRCLLSTTFGAKAIVVDSIELPMAEGPKVCTTALKAACYQWTRSLV